LIKTLEAQGKKVLKCAYTHQAKKLLGGETLPKTFGYAKLTLLNTMELIIYSSMK